jgi:hypothetical protein
MVAASLVAKWGFQEISGKRTRMPGDRDDDCRERLVDVTLDLCMSQGYDATTVDQIAAGADVTPADFERHPNRGSHLAVGSERDN